MLQFSAQGARMDDWTAGDWGGLVAGFVAGLAALGKGLAWLLNWNESRSTGREARLAAWEKSLADRERAYREEIETKLVQAEENLDRVTQRIAQLCGVLRDVTAALRGHDPDSPALSRAEHVLDQMAQ